MKTKMYGKLAVMLALLIILTSGSIVNAYLGEDGTEATILRLDREFSSASSKVGKVETITYRITGDAIVYDPPKEIALVVDVSGSMGGYLGGKTKINILKKTVKDFVEKWENRNCSICIVPFSDRVVNQPALYDMSLADDVDNLLDDISDLSAYGSTNIGDGMRVAYHTLKNSGNANASKYIVTLSDGEPNKYSYYNTYSSYYTGDGIVNRIRSSSTMGLEYCTSIMGNIILNSTYKSFVIGFATDDSLVDRLNAIGQSSGAARLDNGNYHYFAGSQADLDKVYSDISNIIDNDKAITGTTFSELLPVGTVIEPGAVSELESQGFQIIDNYPDPDDPENRVRTKITKALNDCLFMGKKYPEATTAPQNITYQLKPYAFSIKIVYTTPGTKVFKDIDASVAYDDPFMPGAHMSYAGAGASIVVIQPVTGISKTDAIVMPDQIGEPGMISARVLPNVAPNIAYDESIAGWTVTGEKDKSGNTASPGSIISISEPAVPNPLNDTRTVRGLEAGSAAVEAVSSGTDLGGSPVRITCNVYVVDGKVANITMNNGDIRDLNSYAVKYLIGIPADTGTEEMTFSNWRLKDPADAEYINMDPSGTAEAVKTLSEDIPVLVDVDYSASVGSPDSPDYTEVHLKKVAEGIITVAQPVTGVTVEGAVLMAGSGREISAEVEPADAYNIKISSWKFVNESGEDVTESNSIAEITSVAGDENNIRRNVKGTGCGKLTVVAETAGYNADNEKVRGYNTIFVTDAECDAEKTVTLWSSGVSIGTVSHMPSGLSGSIRYSYALANTSDSSKLSVDVNTGEIKGLQLTASPVPVTILAQYFDADGNATGQQKTLTCVVTVAEPDIDIN